MQRAKVAAAERNLLGLGDGVRAEAGKSQKVEVRVRELLGGGAQHVLNKTRPDHGRGEGGLQRGRRKQGGLGATDLIICKALGVQGLRVDRRAVKTALAQKRGAQIGEFQAKPRRGGQGLALQDRYEAAIGAFGEAGRAGPGLGAHRHAAEAEREFRVRREVHDGDVAQGGWLQGPQKRACLLGAQADRKALDDGDARGEFAFFADHGRGRTGKGAQLG